MKSIDLLTSLSREYFPELPYYSQGIFKFYDNEWVFFPPEKEQDDFSDFGYRLETSLFCLRQKPGCWGKQDKEEPEYIITGPSPRCPYGINASGEGYFDDEKLIISPDTTLTILVANIPLIVPMYGSARYKDIRIDGFTISDINEKSIYKLSFEIKEFLK